jgi:hypothetical protein
MEAPHRDLPFEPRHDSGGVAMLIRWSFFFLLPLFSLLLDFHAWIFKFLKQPFNLFFLHIWSMLFWLLFILFETIYKIEKKFNVILLWFFYLSDLVLIFFITICFIGHNFLNWIFLWFHPPLVFFPIRFDSYLFIFLLFLFYFGKKIKLRFFFRFQH